MAARHLRLLLGLACCCAALFATTSAHAATINVTNGNDTGAGSLRNAILVASYGDTILIPALTVRLTSDELMVHINVTIQGAGPRLTTVTGGGTHRVFDIPSSNTVSISNLTVTGGNGKQGTTQGDGGGILNTGTLTLSNDAIVNNALPAGSNANGGGVAADGTTTITATTIANNSAGYRGGGVTFEGNSLTITDTTITGNTMSTPGQQGGGLYANSGGTVLALTNDTISGNSVGTTGGGGGGGIGFNKVPATTVFVNTIVANNVGSGGSENCQLWVSPNWSLGHNLESTTPSQCGFTQPTDTVGVDPMLGALQNNGGPTDTEAIGAASPAYNAGDNTYCPANDQRGVPRPQFGTCDIGAYEYAPAGLSALVVATPASVTLGVNVTLTIAASNLGPDAESAASLADTLPAGVSLVSASASQGSCDGAPALVCTLGALGSGAAATVTLVVHPNALGSYTDTAKVTGTHDPNPANDSSSATFTVTAPVPTTPPAPVPTMPPPPVVSAAKLSPARWRLGSALPSFSKLQVGTTISFNLSQTATVRLDFARMAGAGVLESGKCVKRSKKHRKGPSCTVYTAAGSLTQSGHAGLNKIAFQGRLSRSKRLRPGAYVLTITATAAGGPSPPQTLSFTAVR